MKQITREKMSTVPDAKVISRYINMTDFDKAWELTINTIAPYRGATEDPALLEVFTSDRVLKMRQIDTICTVFGEIIGTLLQYKHGDICLLTQTMTAALIWDKIESMEELRQKLMVIHKLIERIRKAERNLRDDHNKRD